MNHIQARIKALKIQLEGIRRAERYRQELRRKLKAEQKELDLLGQAMEKEHEDVNDLEQWSLKDLFVKVTDKEGQLEKEKEEYLEAVMVYNAVKKDVEMIEFEIDILQEKVNKKEVVEKELQHLFDQQEAAILDNSEDHPLKPLLQQLARWQQLDRELEEAIIRGSNVEMILEAIAQHLIRAKNLGINIMRDPAYRRRAVSREIDEARLRLPKLKLEFIKFEQEVQEVFQFPEIEGWQQSQQLGIRQIEQLIKDLSGFNRSFFKGLIRELLMQQQLHSTHTLANSLRHRTETTVKWLGLEQGKVRKKIQTLVVEKEELLSQ